MSLLTPLLSLPPPGAPPLRVSGVRGLSVAYVAAAVRSFHPARPVVVLTPDEEGAEAVVQDLRFLCGTSKALQSCRVLHYRADERGPYAEQSPDAQAVMERVATLFGFATGKPPELLVASVPAVCRRAIPVRALQHHAQLLVQGEPVEREVLLKSLQDSGYTNVNQVEDMGTYAVRGGIVDVFASGEARPVRIDLFGDVVESLRPFDPGTQRTVQNAQLKEWSFGPAREVVFTEETVARAKARIREQADAQEVPTRMVSRFLEDIGARIPFFGIEALAPAFYPPERPSLLGFLADNTVGQPPVLLVEDPIGLTHALQSYADELQVQHDKARERHKLTFLPEEHAAPPAEIETSLARMSRVDLERISLEEAGRAPLDLEARTTRELRQAIVTGLKTSAGKDGEPSTAADLLEPLVQKLKSLRTQRTSTFLVAETLGGVERLKDLLDGHGLGVRVAKLVPDFFDPDATHGWFDPAVHAYILQGRPTAPAQGAELPKLGVAFIAEEEIFGKRQHHGTRKAAFKTSLADLEAGDFIVHVDHGVGVYRGLTRLALRGVEADYLHVEYAGQDKLYLPVTRINLVQRYAGAGNAHPRLDKLGGTGWENTKQRVKKAILAMAGDLLNLYAKRELSTAHAFPEPDAMYREFEAEFPFEETPDQQKAIDDCLKDLQRGKPMDRLVCGDVGYGKTEVALRAAMLVALHGRQVALLAPTTVLAQQHYLTFSERMKSFPVRVEVLSSFRSAKESKDVLQRVKAGQVDVLVGTHRLLNPDVAFKDLGLIVVDEEHRFGVQHKERLKQMRTQSHVLTMSATPIPRTLQMSFFGVRDLSLIQTPPQDRRAVRTSLARFSPEDIQEAISRELKRGGQVYFVHNRVQSIHAMRDFLQRLVPEARIGIGHGQMEAHALEAAMVHFIKKETNLLLCTTIIESGIDIPTANTIIINRADTMGLAQLYQLRGRVGRSAERGFALLLIPPTSNISPDAKKRLEVLQKFTELGAGFQVAQHDLELRGAGELLGKNQHGHVAAVGYDMYAELLAQAVTELKGRAGFSVSQDVPDPEVNLPIRALIPDTYIPDVHERLGLYQRLAAAREAHEIYDELGAVADQFGEAPPELSALAEVMVIKQKLKEMRARALDVSLTSHEAKANTPPGKRTTTPWGLPLEGAALAGTKALPPGTRIILTLGEGAALEPTRLTEWIAKDKDHRRLTPQMKLVYTPSAEELLAAGDDVTALSRRVLNTLLESAMPLKGGVRAAR